jgi:REP element-mobilizing transposase RayT
LLATPPVASVLVAAWETAPEVYGWIVGRYVVMPDHVHFFAAPCREETRNLSAFVGSWKRWTKRGILALGLEGFEWQAEFFDHLLRSSESYESKWEYVRANPVRAGLVQDPEEWPFAGEVNVLEW